MSELKVYYCHLLHNEYTEFYSKSEADKVIAELEESHKKEVGQLLIEIAELQKQVHDYAQGLYEIQARAENEARHQKYKRCLAMALLCFINGKEKQSVYKLKTFFWSRWGNRWWKLAEQFKEAK